MSQSGNGRTAGKGNRMAGSIFAAVVWRGAANVSALSPGSLLFIFLLGLTRFGLLFFLEGFEVISSWPSIGHDRRLITDGVRSCHHR